MKDYELTLIIDPEVSAEDRKKQVTKIKKIIGEQKGKIEKVDEWGGKKLAYPINKKDLGYYFLLAVKLPENALADLDKKIRLEKKLLRYLLVKKE